VNRLEVRALPLRVVGLQVLAAVVLLSATAKGLDEAGTASQVLLGVAVLLAAMLALAVDEPAAELLDATPTPLSRRVARRLAVLAGAVVPLWLVGLGAVALRGADVSTGMLTLQLAALVALGLALPAALRRWRRVAEPGVLAGPALIGFLLAADLLPRALRLMPQQTWGPPWEVAHLRWSALLLAGASVLLVALSDPATARTGIVRRRG
jgi:hypothetical protein